MILIKSKEIIKDIQDNEEIEVLKDSTGKTIAIPLRQCKKLLEKWRKEDMEKLTINGSVYK